MPIVPFIIIAAVIFSIVSNAKKEQARQQQQQRKAQGLFGTAAADAQAARQEAELRKMREGASAAESEAQRAARQAELKRRLQENAARREAERRAAPSSQGTPTVREERRPLEKRSMQTNLQKEKPTVAHSDDDCGGGSIHDGYHEGVTQFGTGRPPAVAGKLGHDLADEDDRILSEKAAAENAKRAMARIAKLPPLAQGMIYSEILGKPKSEIA